MGRWVCWAQVCGGCEEQITVRLERKEVGVKARPKGSSNLLLARGRLNKGFMASNGQATNKIKKFLEI